MSIEKIIEKADKLLDYGSYKKAQALYEKALNELPSPKEENEQYLEVMAAIADTLIWQNKLRNAVKLYEKILKHPSADSVPYIHMRWGQLMYEMGNQEIAEKELKRALELGGEELFEGEYEEYYAIASGKHEGDSE